MKKKENTIILQRLMSYIKPYRRYLIMAFIFAFLSVLLSLVTPILIGLAIDYIVEKGILIE